MPQNVRNFWIEADIDGRKHRLSGGPVRKDGGFEMTIWQRDLGGIEKAFQIRGFIDVDGRLTTLVTRCDKAMSTLSFETER